MVLLRSTKETTPTTTPFDSPALAEHGHITLDGAASKFDPCSPSHPNIALGTPKGVLNFSIFLAIPSPAQLSGLANPLPAPPAITTTPAAINIPTAALYNLQSIISTLRTLPSVPFRNAIPRHTTLPIRPTSTSHLPPKPLHALPAFPSTPSYRDALLRATPIQSHRPTLTAEFRAANPAFSRRFHRALPHLTPAQSYHHPLRRLPHLTTTTQPPHSRPHQVHPHQRVNNFRQRYFDQPPPGLTEVYQYHGNHGNHGNLGSFLPSRALIDLQYRGNRGNLGTPRSYVTARHPLIPQHELFNNSRRTRQRRLPGLQFVHPDRARQFFPATRHQ